MLKFHISPLLLVTVLVLVPIASPIFYLLFLQPLGFPGAVLMLLAAGSLAIPAFYPGVGLEPVEKTQKERYLEKIEE